MATLARAITIADHFSAADLEPSPGCQPGLVSAARDGAG